MSIAPPPQLADVVLDAEALEVVECENPVIKTKLPPLDEDTEVALGLLWRDFARRAKTHGVDNIDWRAIRYARAGIRPAIRGVIGQYDRSTFLSVIYPRNYREHWLALADEAGQHGGTISAGGMMDAWQVVYGTEHDPGSVPDLAALDDRATEVIGAHMWFRHALGVEDGYEFDTTVIEQGRRHSRYYVRKNVNVFCIVAHGSSPDCIDSNGVDCIDYGRWNWHGVGCCCKKAGRDSCTYANGGGRTAIGPDDFHRAWCDGQKFNIRLMKRLGDNGPIAFTSGCG